MTFFNRLERWSTRPWTLGALGGLIFLQIIALSPSSLEEEETDITENFLTQEEVLEVMLPGDKILAPNIPASRVPDYHTEQYRYLSTQGGEKQWKLQADSANVYNKEKLVHSKEVIIELYDSSDKTTWVTGLEATYHFNQKEVELFGNVKVTLPDGFILESEYLKYITGTKTLEIPIAYAVHGYGESEDGKRKLDFKSFGMTFDQISDEIDLKKRVVFDMNRVGQTPSSTVIQSDHCHIDRKKRMAYFTMAPGSSTKRFAKLNQPGLYVQSRKMDLNYSSGAEVVNYLLAREDVYIEETKNGKVSKTGVCQHARFDNKRNLIIMTQFPQVYQDKNTVTGDKITIDRDTDLIEVEESNAFSKGN